MDDSLTLVTGASGFLGRRLVCRLLAEGASVCALVEPAQEAATRSRLRRTAGEDRLRIVAGDVSRPELGLSAPWLDALRARTTRVFHLAAICDTEVARAPAIAVNAEGTERVLELAARMRQLTAFFHVSSAMVCGTRSGRVLEADLDVGQGFRNCYEQSKFLGELRAREAAKTLPVAIFRPSTVVGDSRTGETDKFDGLYRLFDRVARSRVVILPGACAAPLNVVPVDYVIAAMAAIAGAGARPGQTFHLCDPRPWRAGEVIARVAKLMAPHRPVLRVPRAVVDAPLRVGSVVPAVRRLRLRVDALNSWPEFDVSNTTAALAGSGVRCPALGEYLARIVSFYTRHRS